MRDWDVSSILILIGLVLALLNIIGLVGSAALALAVLLIGAALLLPRLGVRGASR